MLQPIHARPTLAEYLASIWSRKDFIAAASRNSLRAAHLHTALGNGWYLLNPLLQISVYFLVFGVLLDVTRGIDNYLGYLSIGILVFTPFSQCSVAASRCIRDNINIIRSLTFPRATVPLITVVSTMISSVAPLVVMVISVVATGAPLSLRMLAVAPISLLFVLLIGGLTMYLARIGSYFPDLHGLLPHLLRVLFYGSAVIYDPSSFTSSRWTMLLFELNPLYAIIELYRWSLLQRPVDLTIWISASCWAITLSVTGFLFFWHAENSYGANS